MRSLRRRASADSSFSASSTASCTNFLMISSPHGPSARRPKPPANPLMPAKPTPWTSRRLAVERDDAGVLEDLDDLRLLVGLEVVVAEDRDDRNLDRRRELLDERARFLGEAVVGQVAAEREDVGRVVDLGKQRLKRARRGGATVSADRRCAAMRTMSFGCMPSGRQQTAYRSLVELVALRWLAPSRCASWLELLVEGGEGLLEHLAVRGTGGAGQIGGGACAGELQPGATRLPGLLVRRSAQERSDRPRAASSCWNSTIFDSKPRAIAAPSFRLLTSASVLRTPTSDPESYNKDTCSFSADARGRCAARRLSAARGVQPRSAPDCRAPPRRRPRRRRRPPPRIADDSGHPKIVVLGDSLSAGLGLLERQAFPALAAGQAQRRRLQVGGRQRRDFRRHHGGRPAARRLGARPGGRAHPDSRARRQRRPARPAGLGDEEEPRGDHRSARRRRASRSCSRAWKRRRTSVRSTPYRSGRCIAISPGSTRSRCCRSCSTKSPAIPSLNQGDGIHPNIEGTAIVADTVWNVLKPMVDAAAAS